MHVKLGVGLRLALVALVAFTATSCAPPKAQTTADCVVSARDPDAHGSRPGPRASANRAEIGFPSNQCPLSVSPLQLDSAVTAASEDEKCAIQFERSGGAGIVYSARPNGHIEVAAAVDQYDRVTRILLSIRRSLVVDEEFERALRCSVTIANGIHVPELVTTISELSDELRQSQFATLTASPPTLVLYAAGNSYVTLFGVAGTESEDN